MEKKKISWWKKVNNLYPTYVIKTLNDYIHSIKHEKTHEAIQYMFKNCGKMLRPSLLLACAEHFLLPIDEFVHLATALEMIHTYSLIHDDLPCMDNDDYRRGKLTLHKLYGDAFALLIGDILLSDAFKMATLDQKGDVMIQFLSQHVGGLGMVKGQILDMEFEEKAKVDEQDIITMYRHKTGELFAFALACAPLTLKKDISDFEELGYLIGICFQLKDDFDDYASHKDEKKHTLINDFSLEKHQQVLYTYQKLVEEKIEKLKIEKEEALYQMIKKIAF